MTEDTIITGHSYAFRISARKVSVMSGIHQVVVARGKVAQELAEKVLTAEHAAKVDLLAVQALQTTLNAGGR